MHAKIVTLHHGGIQLEELQAKAENYNSSFVLFLLICLIVSIHAWWLHNFVK